MRNFGLGLGLALWLGGCVIKDDPFDGQVEGGESCVEDIDCDAGLRCNGSVCTNGCIDDSECEPPFACGLPGGERTGADGCYERCVYDEECQAGYVCGASGECVQ